MVDKSKTVGPGVFDALYMFCALLELVALGVHTSCATALGADIPVYSFNYGPRALGLLRAGSHVGDWEVRAGLRR